MQRERERGGEVVRTDNTQLIRVTVVTIILQHIPSVTSEQDKEEAT